MATCSPEVKLVICLVPGFNAFTTLAFVDPFRVANYLRKDTKYRWEFVSEAGGRVGSSVGLDVETTPVSTVEAAPDFAMLSSGWIPSNLAKAQMTHAFRRWERMGCVIGGLSSAAYLLAEMGLLDGHKSTVHYETQPAFREAFPNLDNAGDTYVLDRNRISSCGGTGSIDLALECIQQREKREIVHSIGKYIFHPNRRPNDTQQDPLDIEKLRQNASRSLAEAIALFENPEDGVTSIQNVCDKIGISPTKLRRMTKVQTGFSPVKLRDKIRFDKARTLVLQTELSIREIAIVSGFNDVSAFSRAYKSHMGTGPNADRNRWRRGSV